MGMRRMESRKVIEAKEEKPPFQQSILKDDEAQTIEVEKTDFSEVKRSLDARESILITGKRKKKSNSNRTRRKEATEPWFFTHV